MNLFVSHITIKPGYIYFASNINIHQCPYLTTCCRSEVLAPAGGSINMRASSSSSDAMPLMAKAAARQLLYGLYYSYLTNSACELLQLGDLQNVLVN